MRDKWKLKGDEVWIEVDLTWKERRIRWKLRQIMKGGMEDKKDDDGKRGYGSYMVKME